VLLIATGRGNTCEHIFRKSVTTKYLMILHCAGTVSWTSNLCGSDVDIGYWALNIHMSITSCAMILMLNFIDIMYIVSQVITWEARTWS